MVVDCTHDDDAEGRGVVRQGGRVVCRAKKDKEVVWVTMVHGNDSHDGGSGRSKEKIATEY